MGQERMKALGALVGDVVREKNWRHRLGLHQVFVFWREVVGGDIARHAEPCLIKGLTLWVEVSDPVWMQHLQFEKTALLEALNERLTAYFAENPPPGNAPALLDDIRFRPRPPLQGAASQADASRRRHHAAPLVDSQDLERFERVVGAIDDAGIRASMKRIWLVSQGRRSRKADT